MSAAVEQVEVELLTAANLRAVRDEANRFVITLTGHAGTTVNFEVGGLKLAELIGAMAKDLELYFAKPQGEPN